MPFPESLLQQLRAIVEPLGIKVHIFDLPVFSGEKACLHLMSLISLISEQVALVCRQLLPVALWELLVSKGFYIIETPYKEFISSNTLSTNVLATSPGECIMLDGLPKTKELLIASGAKVKVFNGEALCIGCEGGPTCLTRPILRKKN